jgi:hypothetical protein
MPAPDTSRTTATTQTCRSTASSRPQLKIMQRQVGHEVDSSTAVYTHVSSDFMNTALRKALAGALGNDPAGKEQR